MQASYSSRPPTQITSLAGLRDWDSQPETGRTLSLFPPWGALSGMAQTGVSRLVVVAGESFLDRLFALGGQDRGARQRRPQVRGRRRRRIDWRHRA